jgi:hypothetical protein
MKEDLLSPSAIPLPESPILLPAKEAEPTTSIPVKATNTAPPPPQATAIAVASENDPSEPAATEVDVPLATHVEELDVDGLRDRLKLVEQRFTGSLMTQSYLDLIFA